MIPQTAKDKVFIKILQNSPLEFKYKTIVQLANALAEAEVEHKATNWEAMEYQERLSRKELNAEYANLVETILLIAAKD
jgi:hypothetical protein